VVGVEWLYRLLRSNKRYSGIWLPLCVIIITVAMLIEHRPVSLLPVETYQAKRSKIHTVDLFMNSSIPTTGNEHIASFFECNNKGSKCRYLYPGRFYEHYFSIYIKDVNVSANGQSLQWRNSIGLDNANLPALTSLSWWGDFSSWNIGSFTNQQWAEHLVDKYFSFPRNITYIHVHKCGGTSIQSTLSKRATQVKNVQFRMHLKEQLRNESMIIQIKSDVHHYKHSYGGGSAQKKRQWDQQRIDHIRAFNKTTDKSLINEYNQSTFPIFTVIRNPIDRFLSAVQQVMHYNIEFRSKCLHEPANPTNEMMAAAARQQLIQCAIDDINETNYRRDVHLLPMAAHFRLLDGGTDGIQDIPISVFYMDHLQDVLDGIVETLQQSQQQSTGIHTRDRSNEEYATSPILSKLSIDDCSAEMIRQLCTLYHVDYSLLKWLGLGHNAANEQCVQTEKSLNEV
jgi:hypothetical protein